MPMFVADTSGTQTFCQTATEECCVKIMHIKARFLVVGISPTADPLAKRKETLPFCGFCGRQDHRTTHCPVKSCARTVFAALALRRLIATGYNESTDFNPDLRAVLSHAEQVPATWQIPLGDLAPSAPEVSASPSPPPPVEILRDAESMDVEVDPPQDISLSDLSLQAPNSKSVWIQFFSDKPRPFSNEVLSLSGKALHELTSPLDPSSFWISCASKPIPPSSSSLIELGIAPGSNFVVHPSGKGGSLIQRSLDYFLAPSRPPDSTLPPHKTAFPQGALLELHLVKIPHSKCSPARA